MTIYNVYHVYDVGDEYGNAIYAEDYVASFEREDDAKAFVEKYNDPYVYNKPYDELYCNIFIVRESELITRKSFDINDTPKDYGVFIPERQVKANE